MTTSAQPSQSNGFYSRLFARMYDPVMKGMEEKVLLERRAALLRGLQGTILEVGAGTGVNLPLYPSGTTVIAAEPSPDMIRKAKAKWKDNDIQAKVEWLEAGVGDQKLEEYVAPNSLDAVVATLVLCTVSDAQDAINRFYHFLKPGGQLIVLEHIKSSSTPGTFLQNMLTPVWKHIAEGCHLNRPTDQMVKESGFKIVEEEYFTKGVPFFEAVCQKPGA